MDASVIPWGWYVARSSGIVAFLLLYLVIFLGLAIRTPGLKKIIQPCYSYPIHCWLSIQALLFALIHSLSLLFDNFFTFSLRDIFIPFAFQSEKLNTNLGIIGLYLMIIIVISSYARRFIGQKLWRIFHFLNIVLYIFVVIHAFLLGTDLKIPLIRNIFIWLNAFLVFLMLNNLTFRFLKDDNKQDEIVCESDSTLKSEQSGKNF